MNILGIINEKKKMFEKKIKQNQDSRMLSNLEKLDKIRKDNETLQIRADISEALEEETKKNKELKYAKVKKYFPKVGQSENLFSLKKENSSNKTPSLGSPFGQTDFGNSPFPSKDMEQKGMKKYLDKSFNQNK